MNTLILQDTDTKIMRTGAHALMIKNSRSQALEAFGLDQKSLMIAEEKARAITLQKENTDIILVEKSIS